jgi:transposase
VLTVTDWIAIRELRRQGVGIGEIARRTGRDPKTIRKVLREPGPKARPSTWKEGAGKLAPFGDYLRERVGQGCLNATVLLEEIQARGYRGKITILRDFLRPARQDLVRKREAAERFETGPGHQGQVDWGKFGRVWVPEEERWRELYAFVLTLGYSRAQYLRFTTCCDLEHFLDCHLGAFARLGIPAELLYDNLKTAILGRRADGAPIFPGRFLDFALYHGFTPKFCQPYRARTKGKTERGIGYVRQNFWVRVAAEVASKELVLPGLNDRARDWVERVANARVHGTHGEVVATRYAAEAPLLGKLVGRPRFDTAYHALRRVGRDGRLSYRGKVYQVGLRHALGTVEVTEGLTGEITLRGPVGERVRFALVPPGAVAPKDVVWADEFAGGTARKAPIGEGVGPLILVGGIGRASPAVEVRDLTVYEEVARAAGAG